jgi:RNA polymerase sigma factor (sigma-70 family)
VKVSRQTVRPFIAGDEEAIPEVYLSYRSLVFFIIVSIVKNEEDAKDLYQDTFVDAIAKARSIANIDGFEQYLTRIARNKALNFVKEKTIWPTSDRSLISMAKKKATIASCLRCRTI